jgi:type I restriction-modification system DNA methylase subunit
MWYDNSLSIPTLARGVLAMPGVPQKVRDLVAIFERNADQYLDANFNEANLRQQFVNPLFRCLGWDMDNEAGYAEAYKDVIHEASVKVGEETKAPDYCFRISQTPKFYVEAKKPSVNINTDPKPAFQLRRYGWSKKLPLSILTDFEEFAVYDCRFKPSEYDKPSDARVMYLRYTDYAKQWDEIAGIFSREAILKGSFDKYAESNKGKRGTTPVDAAFLQEIEEWRFELAKNLALRNRHLTPRELNYAVQMTIDRIIFLRLCEDRGVEPYGQLQRLMDHAGIYDELSKLFHKADQRYNSGLFHFEKEKDRPEAPDELTTALKIDDKVLKSILKSMYYPCPYVFKEIPPEILGQVYEQFLGKVIRLTTGHTAKIEEKPEVKKAGGVYYTPTYIVDYIVKHTVGQLLGDHDNAPATEPEAQARDAAESLACASGSEAKSRTLTPKQARNLRILDPACGSGSFLLGANNYLLKWYRDAYVKDGPEKHKKELFQSSSGDSKLTTAERKKILVSNLYGVDIDPQAVEVTKLSLLLKVLEGESQEMLNQQLLLFHERALPDLASNIKCGNSLIGPDFYEGQQPMLFDEEEKYRINVFDWNAAFSDIMKAGGFDAVIGNPPYVRQESLSDFKEYFLKHYESAEGSADLYAYFMEKGVKLLRDGGLFSIIVSSSFLRATYGEALRRVLKAQGAVIRIVDFGGLAVFANAKDTYVCIPLLAKGAKQDRVEISKIPSLEIQNLTEYVSAIPSISHMSGFPQKHGRLNRIRKLPYLAS